MATTPFFQLQLPDNFFGSSPEPQPYTPFSGQFSGLLGQAQPSFGLDQPQPNQSFLEDMGQFIEDQPPDPPLVKPTDLVRPIALVKPTTTNEYDPVNKDWENALVRPDTANAGDIARQHSQTDAAMADLPASNYEVQGGPKAEFAQALNQLINSPQLWGASAEELHSAAIELAKQYGDPSLADAIFPAKGAKTAAEGYQQLVDYRKRQGAEARPSPVDWSGFGEKTSKTEEGQKREVGIPFISENTSTARMKAGFRENAWAAAEAGGEILGFDMKKADERRRYYNTIGNLIGGGLAPSDVKNFSDALRLVAQTTVEQGPYLAASSAGGLVGGAVGGSVGAYLGAFGTSYGIELGQVEENTKDLNPDQKAGLATAIGAGGAALLDSVLPGKVGSALTKRLGAKAAEEAAWQILLQPADKGFIQAVKSGGADLAKGALVEGSTEAAQQLIEEASGSYQATGKVQFEPGLLDRMVQVGIAGAILGGPSNAVAEASQRTQLQNAPIDELANAQFTQPASEVAANSFTPGFGITPQENPFPSARPLVRPVEQRGGPSIPVVPTPRPVDTQGNQQEILIPKGPITSQFGPRHSFPTLNGKMASSNHAGIDIGLPEGAKVPAAADGVVVFAGEKGGYGNTIIVKFSDGTSVLYGHLSRIGVEVGDDVSQGETIGRVGHTGNATGPHLHFERRDAQGRPVNPLTAKMVETNTSTGADGQPAYSDNTGWSPADTAVDYGSEDYSKTQTQIDDSFEQATGQSLREPQIETQLKEPTGAVAVAERVLGDSSIDGGAKVADDLAAELDNAHVNNVAEQRLEELKTAAPQEQRDQQQPQDFTQPLAGEEPVFAEDQQQVMGFIDNNGNVRRIGEPPSSASGNQDFVAAPAQKASATTPVATESSAIPEQSSQPLPKQRVIDTPRALPYRGFGEDQTHVAYEVAPPASNPISRRWEALSLPEQAKITTHINRLVLPPLMRKLRLSAQISGHIGAWDGKLAPSLVLSTRNPHMVIEAARHLGHALNQDAVMVISESPLSSHTQERGTIRIADVPEQSIPEINAKLSRAGLNVGFTQIDDHLVIVNHSDIPTDHLGAQVDEALGGAYKVFVGATHSALLERGGDNYGFEGTDGSASVEQQDFNRLAARAGNALVRSIERAEGRRVGANEQNGEAGPFRWTPELEKPPVENGEIVLDHYGPAGLTKTDPSKWGTNASTMSRDERNYLSSGIPRTWFGIAAGKPGGYVVEFPDRVHYQARVPADKLYDVASDPDGLRTGKPWLTERAIRDAGYAGYWLKNPSLGLVAGVFEPLKVSRVTEQAKPKLQSADDKMAKQRIFWEAFKGDVMRAAKETGALGRVGLEIVGEIGTPAGGKAAGEYYQNMIRIAAADWGKQTTPYTTTRHELVHWAKENLFTSLEWHSLAKWAKNNPYLMGWAREAYSGHGLTEDELVEEAVAEGYAKWAGGDVMSTSVRPKGLVAKAMAKLKDWIAKIQRAFNMAGISQREIEDAARILGEFQSGKTVQKFDERAALERARKKFGRRPVDVALSRALQDGRISPREYEVAKLTPKQQSAWHGSGVSDIDQFKLDFIGTGEGAQVYGWGLYFAKAKEVAEYYRTALSGNFSSIKVNGVYLRNWVADNLPQWNDHFFMTADIGNRIYDYLRSTAAPPNGWLGELRGQFEYENLWAQRDAENGGQLVELEHLQRSLESGLAIFDALVGQKITGVRRGGLYEVDVPENDELLSYDKPLIQQSEKVRTVLTKIYGQLKTTRVLDEYEGRSNEEFWQWTGADLVKKILPRMVFDDAFPRDVSPETERALENGDAAQAASLWLKELGIPGLRYLDRSSRGGGDGTHNFVIFDDSLVKINARYQIVDDSLLSDPSVPNAGLWGRAHTAIMAVLSSIGGADFDPTDRLIEAWKRKIVNKFQPIIKAQENLKKNAGLESLPSEADPYLHIATDERGYKLNYLADNFVQPMAKEMAQRGVSLEDLGLYLYARHAPYRNAKIASINPEFNTTDKPGSGMTNKEAADILRQFADDGRSDDLAKAADYIDGMVQWAQQEMKDGGLISDKEIANWFGPSEFYVPLKGNEALEPDVEFGFTPASLKGGGFSVSGREIHRMYGRASKADLEGIVGNVVTQAQQAADRAYRNQVAQKILGFIKASGDKEFAVIDRVKRVPVWNKATGQVEYQLQKRVVNPEEQARTIYAKTDGQDHKITFNQHNPSAMRFVRAAKNLDMAKLNRGLQVVGGFTRLWSSLQTTYNPEFLVRNAARDIQTALINSQGGTGVDVKGLAGSIAKNISSLSPLRAAWAGSFHDTGALFGSAKDWEKTYAEFEANGGKLNYNQVEPVSDALKKIEKEFRWAQRGKADPRVVARTILQTIDHANSAIENMTRLAAYKALRDRGIEAKVAAKVARELTTNFAQHGEWGPTLNALYGFGNATLIGSARLTKSIVANPKLLFGMIMAGFLQDLLNSWWDEKEWDAYSEEDKDYHWTILLPDWLGVNLHIPIGYGINSFVTVGRKISELMRGHKNSDGTKETPINAAGDIFSSFANAWSPVQGYSIYNILAPSLLDPFVDIVQNKNHWGQAVMPSQPDRLEQQRPDSQLAFENTGQFWKTIAQGMNRATGGNEVVPGLIDVSPESIKHVATELGGGGVRTAGRAITAAQKLAEGKAGELGPNDIPFARAFVGRPYGAANTEGEVMSAFYDRVNDARVTIGQAKEMKARFGMDSKTYQDFRKANAPIINFYPKFQAMEKKLNEINAADNAAKRGTIRADGLNRRDRGAIFKVTHQLVPHRKLTEDEVKALRDSIRDKRVKLATRFNRAYLEDVMGEDAP